MSLTEFAPELYTEDKSKDDQSSISGCKLVVYVAMHSYISVDYVTVDNWLAKNAIALSKYAGDICVIVFFSSIISVLELKVVLVQPFHLGTRTKL